MYIAMYVNITCTIVTSFKTWCHWLNVSVFDDDKIHEKENFNYVQIIKTYY